MSVNNGKIPPPARPYYCSKNNMEIKYKKFKYYNNSYYILAYTEYFPYLCGVLRILF